MYISILFWLIFIIGMLCGSVITVMWEYGDTPISYISNVQEKTYHSDSYMKRYPFEPNFIDVNTSDCNNPQITSLGYIHSIREGMKISWMLCNNTDFDYAMAIHANGTKWEKQNKPYETVQIGYAVAGGSGPSTQLTAPIKFGPITEWTVPTNVTKLDLYVIASGGPIIYAPANVTKLEYWWE